MKCGFNLKKEGEHMLTAVSRLRGDSVIVSLPSNHGQQQPEPNQEYIVDYTKDGTIILVPTTEYPFLDQKEETFEKLKAPPVEKKSS